MDTSQRLQHRLNQLTDMGFMLKEDRVWFEPTSEITLLEANIALMSDELFNRELEFIDYVLSK